LSYRRVKGKMVTRDGNAPPSAGCGPAALLLSYRANEKMAEHQGFAPRTLDPSVTVFGTASSTKPDVLR
jgi:hypothetical protein